MRSRVPEPAERACELEVAQAVAVLQGIERTAEVVVLFLELSDPGQAKVEPLRVGELGELDVVVGVPAAHRVGFASFLQQLAGVLADRLQHPEALLRVPEQALVEQGLQAGDVGAGYLLGRLERAAAAEDGQAGEEPLLVRREQVVRPGDRRPQRLLARVGVAAGPEQVQSLRDPLEDLSGCEHADPGGGELERQRQVVEPAAQLDNSLVRLDARPRAEQLDRLWLGESRYRVDELTVDPQQLPAGDEQAQVSTGPQQSGQVDRRLYNQL